MMSQKCINVPSLLSIETNVFGNQYGRRTQPWQIPSTEDYRQASYRPSRRKSFHCLSETATSTASRPLVPEANSQAAERRTRLVVCGSGWAAVSFVKALPKNIREDYEVVLISPRSYFLFTALLPGVCTGKLEARSITESVRRLIHNKGTYYEAEVKDVDVGNRSLELEFPAHAGLAAHPFSMTYDLLLLAVGSCANTFGVKGVKENCFFFKSISDATGIRQRICESFERAALPGISDEERRQLLTFVIVGGGPTGVEVAAEVYDLLHQDMQAFYQAIFPLARVILVELQDHILSTYDREISDYTSELFARNGIQLILNARVVSVEEHALTLDCKDAGKSTIPFSACVWATGVAINPLAKKIQDKIPAQSNFRSLVTDEWTQVVGSEGTIFALGDAATVDQPKAREYACTLFDDYDSDSNGSLSLAELRELLRTASKKFSHLEEHALFLEENSGLRRFGGLLAQQLSQGRNSKQRKDGRLAVEGVLESSDGVTRPEFEKMIETIDQGLRALPATGQVAGQQGRYLAKLFTTQKPRPGKALPEDAPAFRYNDGGSVAYIGNDQAVMDLPSFRLKGRGAGVLWRGWETYRQISNRNKTLVAFDWLRTRLFGRDFEYGDIDV